MSIFNSAITMLATLALAGCNYTDKAKDEWQQASASAGLEWNKLKEELLPPPPRVVPRGAKPEVIVEGKRITFNGYDLGLGVPLEAWLDVLSPPSREDGNEYGTVLAWDSLGIQIVAREESGGPRKSWPVKAFSVQFVDATYIPYILQPAPEGRFTGYLQIDGVGIDAHTAAIDWDVLGADMPRPIRIGCSRLNKSRCGDIEHQPPLYIDLDKAARNVERVTIGM